MGLFRHEYESADIYRSLRQRVFSTDPSQLGLQHGSSNPVWGALMETGRRDAIVTLVMIADGTVSLYFSNGGGMIGIGQHKGPKEAGQDFLACAQEFLQDFTPAKDYPLPMKGFVRFYLLTFTGIFTAEAKETDLAKRSFPLSPLFDKAHEVITQVRHLEERSKLLANAVTRQEVSEVRRLIDEGVLPNFRNPEGIPVLAVAVSMKDIELVRLLLSAGADPDIKSTNQERGINEAPVINFAAGSGDVSVLSLLIEAGADIEGADATGLTPLMCAAFMGDLESLERLLQAGSTIDAKDTSGYTALMFACNAGHASCVRALLCAGADINARDKDNSIPLMFAAQHGHDEVVRLLLNMGADPHQKGDHGMSAIDFARQNGLKQTEKILFGT